MVIRLVVTRVEVLELCNQLVLACLRWFAKQEVVCCAVTFDFNVLNLPCSVKIGLCMLVMDAGNVHGLCMLGMY